MEQGTELVFSTSEILLAIMNELDEDWRKNVLVGGYLIQDIRAVIDKLRVDQVFFVDCFAKNHVMALFAVIIRFRIIALHDFGSHVCTRPLKRFEPI